MTQMSNIGAASKTPASIEDSPAARQPRASTWQLVAFYAEHYHELDQILREDHHRLALVEVELAQIAARHGLLVRFSIAPREKP